MASGEEGVVEWQRIKKQVTCSLCGNLFTDPKTISCMHTFCMVCLENSMDKYSGILSCPLCQANCSQDNLYLIPTNSTIKHLVENYAQQRKYLAGMVGIGCGKCKEDSVVIAWCNKCEKLLCHDCYKMHSKWEEFKSHEAVSLEVFTKLGCQSAAATTTCGKHSKPLNLYCKTCDSVVCHECVLQDHCKHSFVGGDKTGAASGGVDSKSQKHSTSLMLKLVTRITKKSSKDHTSAGDVLLQESVKKESSKFNKDESYSKQKLSIELNYPLFIGKYGYSARTDEDLSFKKGELLYIIRDDDDGWWLAKKKGSGQQGYIPSSYVKEYKSLLDAEDWYFRVFSNENQLLQAPNIHGSFLVRDGETSKGYSLLLRVEHIVKKYKIHKTDDEKYFIVKRKSFDTLQQLVTFYSNNDAGLPVKLKSPCVIAEDLRTIGLSKSVYKQWKIPRCSLLFHKQLGRGQLGEVWEAVWNKTTPVAVKTLNPGIINLPDFLKEVTALRKLHHRNVLQLYAVCIQEELIYIITELMKQGNLLNYLFTGGRTLKLPQLVNMAAQVAAGMAYLEKNNIIHGKIAARNILLSDHLICRVGCFSITNTVRKYDNTMLHRLQIAIKWASPEVMKFGYFTIKSDVWSFGILLYELVTHGGEPYPTIEAHKAMDMVIKSGYRMPCPTDCPQNFHKIMMKCWDNDVSCRPTFETLQWQLEEYFVDQGLYAATVSTPCLDRK